jgi:cobalt/nickel transport system permease protein
MHIMEGYLPWEWCVVWYAIALPILIYGAWRIVKIVREHPEQKMIVALSGAFIFLLSSLKLPSVTGSSSHPTGTGLSTVLYGVACTSFLSVIVLLFQALLLAHGGLTTLGANVVSMGIVGPFVGYAVWRLLRGQVGMKIATAMFFTAVVADMVTYIFTSFELALAYPGTDFVNSFIEYLSVFAVTQIPLAIIEGVIFSMFAVYLANNRPEVFGDITEKDIVTKDKSKKASSRRIYFAGFAVIASIVIVAIVYGLMTGADFGGTDDAGGSIIDASGTFDGPWWNGLFGDFELSDIQEKLLFLLQGIIGLAIILYFLNYVRVSRRRAQGLPTGKRGGVSEQVQMDTLAYSSRMVGWSPLGKMFLILSLIVVGLLTNSIVVPICTLIIGLTLMAYSTNFKIPSLIALAIGEAILIMIIGCGMISIMGKTSDPALWDTNILWFHIHMTEASFNQAWLVFLRAIAGVTLMLAFATSTPIPHLAQALGQIKIPKEITEIMVLIYRYSFLLLERMQTMRSAADCRLGFAGFVRSFKTTAGIAIGVFSSSMEIGDKAQCALDCRNYSGTFPVFRVPRKISVKWVIFSITLAVVLLVFGMYSVGWIDMSDVFFGKV